MKALIKNFKDHQIEQSNRFLFGTMKHSMHHYYKLIRNLTISLFDIFVNFVCARITLRKKILPTGNIYLLHQYIEINSLRDNNKLQSRYFPYLKEYFDKESINLYHLTWSKVFWSGKIKSFKKLRRDSCFIPEDWLNIYDYFLSVRNFFKAKFCFSSETTYPKIDIKHLILNEKKNYLEKISSNLRFWTYKPAIKKWSKNCKSLTCIDHYENMIFEHALIAAIRNLDIKTKICGYHHTLASCEFTAWHSLQSEWSSKFKPDCVISLGSISTKTLRNQGVPPERIIDGPALRYNNILVNESDKIKKNKNNVLIPLSQIKDASYELVNKIKILSKALENTEYIFIIKPHPNLEISKILLSLGLHKLPKNVIISNEDIDKLLNTCLFTIFMSTGAAYNAVINGNVVFNLESELNFSDNYLDIFEKEFQYVHSYSLESIQSTLLEFINNNQKIEEYSDEFDRLSKYLISGMNVPNKKNLDKFRLN